MVKRFLESERTGFYLAVLREGEVGAGDDIRVVASGPVAVPVSQITRLYIAKRWAEEDVASVRRALQVASLPASWKELLSRAPRKSLNASQYSEGLIRQVMAQNSSGTQS
ncbi:MAG TPA: hypothetical protein VKS44_16940 [Candidatus Acidoferrales bacterium]|nr:hypothetical protein [Candidatus Acidoferrales bacterium]